MGHHAWSCRDPYSADYDIAFSSQLVRVSYCSFADVDFSQNALPRVPDVLYTLSTLRRLNLSDNAISEVSHVIGGKGLCTPF